MTNEQIAENVEVIKLKAELFDIISYQEYLKTQYNTFDKARSEKLNELQELIKLQEEVVPAGE